MLLKQKLIDEKNAALKAGEKIKKGALVSVLARVTNVEKESKVDNLGDQDVIAVITKSIKERKESASMFTDGGRIDLADKENAEITVLQVFLPEQLDETAVLDLVKETISDTGASTIKDMGKVMGILKPKIQGKAEMGKVSGLVKSLLN